MLPLSAIVLFLLSIAAPWDTTGTPGSGHFSLGREKVATTPVDVAQWEQGPICVDTEAWQVSVSGGSITNISWHATPDEIVIVITGTVPNDDGAVVSAPTYW